MTAPAIRPAAAIACERITVTNVARSTSEWPDARRGLVSVGAGRYAAAVLAIAAAYYALAVGGKALLLPGPAGAVWPAAGFAVAVLYLGGLGWWPAILLGDLGSLTGDVLSDELAVPVGTALTQAVGDITGLLVAAVLLRRLAGRRAAMDRLQDVAAVLVAVAAGAAISAAVAMLSLRAGGRLTASEMPVFWRGWWLGDVAGGLVVVPLALAWAPAWRRRPPAWRQRRVEGALMITAVIALSVIDGFTAEPLTYLVFPAFTWAALRFGPQGATLAIALAVLIAVWSASNDHGPFVQHSPTHNALSLQLYVAAAALTTLCLAAIVSERRRATGELAESRARNALAAADERRRIEGELHDSAQNRLVALILRLSLSQETFENRAPEVSAVLAGFSRDAEDVLDDLRRIARGMAPPQLAAHGLVDALRAECAASAVPVEINAGRIERSGPEIETAVYLCCLEAVQNASKHAGRDARVRIDLRREGRQLAFSIHDTGQGFDPATAGMRGAALASARARIDAVGGDVDVSSTPGTGTTVAGLVPWTPREP